MRLSRSLFVTLRDVPSEAEIPSHQLLLRAGYVRRLGSGLYAHLPLLRRVLARVEAIVREELDALGAQEVSLPHLQDADLWRASGRWDAYTGGEGLLFHLADRAGREHALAPTHEEAVAAVARDTVGSYRQLPLTLYQIGAKFRDELRPRFGLLRTREFVMKDAYSFHADEADLAQTYEAMSAAYARIFARCGLEVLAVDADSGAIGGAVSREFMVLADVGEDEVLYTPDGRFAANVEKAGGRRAGDAADHDAGQTLRSARGIEVGHVFQLGTRYAEALGATFAGPDGRARPLWMGCYGIGVTRLAAAAAEQHHDADGLRWPTALAPHHAVVTVANASEAAARAAGERLYAELRAAGVDAALDDREERAGVKFRDADLAGFPYRVTVGRGLAAGEVEVRSRRTGEARAVPVEDVAAVVAARVRADLAFS